MTTSLEEIFSEGHLRAYAGVCLDLAMDMPRQFETRDLDTLVIPSRGAVPLFIGTMYGLNKLRQTFGGEYEDFYRGLGVQRMIAPLLPSVTNISTDVDNSKYRVLLIPFTADLNIERFDPSINTDDYVLKTRNFWTRVTDAFFDDPKARRDNPYFRVFTDVVLKDVEGRPEVAKGYENFPSIKKFGLMDTVISGRAATQILQAFDGISKERGFEAVPYYAFLIVDENERKLRAPFKPFLNRKQALDELKKYPIARIVSEDEGASLLGVAAVVYPSLMRESQRNLVLKGSAEEFFMGAGSWRLGSDLGKEGEVYRDSFNKFKRLIYCAIDHVFSRDYGEDQGQMQADTESFRQARQDFLDHLSSGDILKTHGDLDPSILGISRSYTPKGSYETGSRVAHVPFTDESTSRILDSVCRRIPGITCREKKK